MAMVGASVGVLGVPAPVARTASGGNFRSAQIMIASKAITPTAIGCLSSFQKPL